MINGLQSTLGTAWDLDVESSRGHMISSMMVTEYVGVRMMKEYFEIEASKATQQYGFRKGLKLFNDEGYQATKVELKVNLLGRGCTNMLSSNNLTWDIRKQVLFFSSENEIER